MDMAAIMEELADHGFNDTSEQRKLDVINDTYFDVCSREAWPFLEKQINLSFTGNDTASNFPADFSKLISLVEPTTGSVIKPTRLDDFANNFTLVTDTGAALRYYFLGNSLRINPKPPSGSTLVLNYTANPEPLVPASDESDILIPPRHHRVLSLGSLVKLYLMEDDPELAQAFQAQFEARIQTMRADLWQRDFAPDFIHETDPFVDPLLGF